MMYLKTYEILIILVALLSIVLINPIGDAIRDNGNKRAQKNLELIRDTMFWIIFYIVTKDLTFCICTGLSYFFFRISIHNLAYNWSRKPKLPWYYVGTTSWSDDVENRIAATKWQLIVVRIGTFLFALLLFWYAIKY